MVKNEEPEYIFKKLLTFVFILLGRSWFYIWLNLVALKATTQFRTVKITLIKIVSA